MATGSDEIRRAHPAMLAQLDRLRTLRNGYRIRATRQINRVIWLDPDDPEVALAFARAGVLNDAASDLNRIIIEIERTTGR